MSIKYLLTDLDDTIYSYKKNNQYAIEKVFKSLSKATHLDIALIFITFEIAKKKVKLLLTNSAASHNRFLYFQVLFELLNISPVSDSYNYAKMYWDCFLENISPFDGAMDFLQHLKTNKIPVVIVTDMVLDIQLLKLKALGISKHVDYIVSSEEVGVEKPHPFIFQYALQKVNGNVTETMFIGDSLKKDVVGAANLNFSKVVYYNDNTQSLNIATTSKIINTKNFSKIIEEL